MRNQRFSIILCLLGVLMLAGAVRATAQEPDPAQAARFKFGVLSFTPSITLTNVGLDTNVFNDPENPKQDQTGGIGPSVDVWMHAGPSRLSGKFSGQYLYFKQYDNQRALNTNDEIKLEFPLARITPFVTATYANTKDRPGFEIDSRTRLASDSVGLGTEVRLSGKTSLVLSGTRSRTRFAEEDTFLGTDLAAALNRRTDAEQLELRYKLTSLTTFVIASEAIQDHFLVDQLRNGRSVSVMPGFELKPSALISGLVFVGYRQFDPVSANIPGYQGLVASVDTTYTVRATQLGLRVNRDLVYSYQLTQPYYALTDVGASITQRLTYTWDVVARGSRQQLDYRRLVTSAKPAQVDTIQQFGGGIGYRVGHILRLGFDGNYYRRRSSDVLAREYKGARFGASVTYGLPQ